MAGLVALGLVRCEGCARCPPAPASPTTAPPALVAPPAADAALPPLTAPTSDDWMNSRIQRILQRQRAELDVAPRMPRRWTTAPAPGHEPTAGASPPPAAPLPVVDAGAVTAPAPPGPRRATHDPALERHLRRELDETLAEIARVEALSRSVQARVQTASNRAELQDQLRRIEGELRDLRALHRALQGELAALERP